MALHPNEYGKFAPSAYRAHGVRRYLSASFRGEILW